jgi:hypothetical protein
LSNKAFPDDPLKQTPISLPSRNGKQKLERPAPLIPFDNPENATFAQQNCRQIEDNAPEIIRVSE